MGTYMMWNDEEICFDEKANYELTTQENFLAEFDELLKKYNVDRVDVNINSVDSPECVRVIFNSNDRPLTLFANAVAKITGGHKFSNYYRLWKRETGFIVEREIVKVTYDRDMVRFEGGDMYTHKINEDDEAKV